jgi:hypothetical protein
MSNSALKERRARSWRNGRDRKEIRKIEQKEREKANRLRRARGEQTPWEIACAARAERRKGIQRGDAPAGRNDRGHDDGGIAGALAALRARAAAEPLPGTTGG